MNFLRVYVAVIMVAVLIGVGLISLRQPLPMKDPIKLPENASVKQPMSPKSSSETFQKIDEKYCINYGNAKAPIKIIEFFSLQCPHCIRLFRSDFQKIKENLIDSGKVRFTFHPVPQDLATVQAMICFAQLDESEKQLFLEALFEECEPSDAELMLTLMMTAMNVFKKPLEKLGDEAFLQNHPVLDEVYGFLKQEKIFAVPTVEVDGHLFINDVPSYSFIRSFSKD